MLVANRPVPLLTVVPLLTALLASCGGGSDEQPAVQPANEWSSDTYCPRVGAGAQATFLATNGDSTWAVLADGRLAVWGEATGWLFHDDRTGTVPHDHGCFYPLIVPLAENVRSVVPGVTNRNGCVLWNDGTVGCWENDTPAEVVDWQKPETGWKTLIEPVAGVSGIADLSRSALSFEVLLRSSNGSVFALDAWSASSGVHPIGDLASVRAVSGADELENTAVLSDGTVMAWGGGSHTCGVPYGVSGVTNTSVGTELMPAPFPGLAAVESTKGECAIHTDRSLTCWNCASLMPYWSGADADHPEFVPAKIVDVDDVVDVADMDASAGGRGIVYALTGEGVIMRWGWIDSAFKRAEVFATVPNAKQIVGGGEYGCVLIEGGAVQCWGDNSAGQCGQDPSSVYHLDVPTTVQW